MVSRLRRPTSALNQAEYPTLGSAGPPGGKEREWEERGGSSRGLGGGGGHSRWDDDERHGSGRGSGGDRYTAYDEFHANHRRAGGFGRDERERRFNERERGDDETRSAFRDRDRHPFRVDGYHHGHGHGHGLPRGSERESGWVPRGRRDDEAYDDGAARWSADRSDRRRGEPYADWDRRGRPHDGPGDAPPDRDRDRDGWDRHPARGVPTRGAHSPPRDGWDRDRDRDGRDDRSEGGGRGYARDDARGPSLYRSPRDGHADAHERSAYHEMPRGGGREAGRGDHRETHDHRSDRDRDRDDWGNAREGGDRYHRHGHDRGGFGRFERHPGGRYGDGSDDDRGPGSFRRGARDDRREVRGDRDRDRPPEETYRRERGSRFDEDRNGHFADDRHRHDARPSDHHDRERRRGDEQHFAFRGDPDIQLPPPRSQQTTPAHGVHPAGVVHAHAGGSTSTQDEPKDNARDAFQAELERVAAEQEAERQERRRRETNKGTPTNEREAAAAAAAAREKKPARPTLGWGFRGGAGAAAGNGGTGTNDDGGGQSRESVGPSTNHGAARTLGALPTAERDALQAMTESSALVGPPGDAMGHPPVSHRPGQTGQHGWTTHPPTGRVPINGVARSADETEEDPAEDERRQPPAAPSAWSSWGAEKGAADAAAAEGGSGGHVARTEQGGAPEVTPASRPTNQAPPPQLSFAAAAGAKDDAGNPAERDTTKESERTAAKDGERKKRGGRRVREAEERRAAKAQERDAAAAAADSSSPESAPARRLPASKKASTGAKDVVGSKAIPRPKSVAETAGQVPSLAAPAPHSLGARHVTGSDASDASPAAWGSGALGGVAWTAGPIADIQRSASSDMLRQPEKVQVPTSGRTSASPQVVGGAGGKDPLGSLPADLALEVDATAGSGGAFGAPPPPPRPPTAPPTMGGWVPGYAVHGGVGEYHHVSPYGAGLYPGGGGDAGGAAAAAAAAAAQAVAAVMEAAAGVAAMERSFSAYTSTFGGGGTRGVGPPHGALFGGGGGMHPSLGVGVGAPHFGHGQFGGGVGRVAGAAFPGFSQLNLGYGGGMWSTSQAAKNANSPGGMEEAAGGYAGYAAASQPPLPPMPPPAGGGYHAPVGGPQPPPGPKPPPGQPPPPTVSKADEVADLPDEADLPASLGEDLGMVIDDAFLDENGDAGVGGGGGGRAAGGGGRGRGRGGRGGHRGRGGGGGGGGRASGKAAAGAGGKGGRT